MGTIDEIAAMRDWKVPAAVTGTATATAQFVILVEYDPRAGKFKVTDTRYESGAKKLKTAGKALLKVNVGYTSPDGSAVRVVRRGTFLCSGVGNCEFMLPEVSQAKSVPVPVKVVN
jgi:hypothetical protein